MSEIEGMNSIGKSVSVSFRVRVVRASGRSEAAWVREASDFLNAGVPVGELCCFVARFCRGSFDVIRVGFQVVFSRSTLYIYMGG